MMFISFFLIRKREKIDENLYITKQNQKDSDLTLFVSEIFNKIFEYHLKELPTQVQMHVRKIRAW